MTYKASALRDEIIGSFAGATDPTGMSNGSGNFRAIWVEDAPTISQIKQWDKDVEGARITGNAQRRLVGRRRAIREFLLKDPTSNKLPWSEFLGDNFSSVLPTILGGAAGAYIGTRKGLHGKELIAPTAAFAALGLGLSGLGAVAPAFVPFSRRRTLKEQMDYENKSHWLKHSLIPGTASYDYWKAIQASQYLSEMPEKQLRAELAKLKKNAALRDYVKEKNTRGITRFLTPGVTWGALTGGTLGAALPGNNAVTIPSGVVLGSLTGLGTEKAVDRLFGKGYGSLASMLLGAGTLGALGYKKYLNNKDEGTWVSQLKQKLGK